MLARARNQQGDLDASVDGLVKALANIDKMLSIRETGRDVAAVLPQLCFNICKGYYFKKNFEVAKIYAQRAAEESRKSAEKLASAGKEAERREQVVLHGNSCKQLGAILIKLNQHHAALKMFEKGRKAIE
jgi:tetratricopeptide (TPR) repeat protein